MKKKEKNQEINSAEIAEVDLLNILRNYVLEADVDIGKKFYVGERDGKIMLEKWGMRQNGADDVDWVNIENYELKLKK